MRRQVYHFPSGRRGPDPVDWHRVGVAVLGWAALGCAIGTGWVLWQAVDLVW